jgi:hypothetical protein
MVDAWGGGKRYFKNGLLPDVSATGNWSDIGLYTLMTLCDTTYVGCAKASAHNLDIIVCSYSPHGNCDGQRVY